MTTSIRRDTKVPLLLLEVIPKGCYALRPDTATPYTFLRLARPKTKRRLGWTVVQTQHSEQWIERWALDPSGRVWCYDRTIEDKILQLIVGHRKAGRDYAAEIGNCHRCNTTLTDERSRHYGFGPECEKALEGEKDEIDDENGGTYEELRDRGELTV